MRARTGRTAKFTIWHGFASSAALHLALVLPFALGIASPPPDEPPLLVLDFQGVVAEDQSEQKMMEETKGAMQPEKQEEEQVAKPTPMEAPPPPPDDPPTPVAEEVSTPPPPAEAPAATQSHNAGVANILGAQEQKDAQTIKAPPTEKDLINAYVTLLSKKVRSNLVHPKNGRDAAAVVAFTILVSGQIRAGSLKVAESSGQAALDESALKTILASTPFDPPPRELNLAIAVDFSRKR